MATVVSSCLGFAGRLRQTEATANDTSLTDPHLPILQTFEYQSTRASWSCHSLPIDVDMALTERDKNSMTEKGKGNKRKKVEIDLTADSDTEDLDAAPTKKSQKNATNYNNGQRKDTQKQRDPNASAAYQTPPASSAPRSSQPANTQSSRYGSVYNSTQILADDQHSQGERDAWLADDEDDVNEIIPSTQAAATNTEELHLYGDLPIKIVGVQYYRGYAQPGEQILMRREPGNPYDKNAIRIDNVAGTQIGHIPRRIAEKLAGFMDNSFLHVEASSLASLARLTVLFMYACMVLIHRLRKVCCWRQR